MKPYPKVRQRQYRTLLWPSPDPRLDARDPRWTTQRAIGSPVFVARCLANEELFTHLRKFKDLEAKKCPVPFQYLFKSSGVYNEKEGGS